MNKEEKEKLEKEIIEKMPFRFKYFLKYKSKELKIDKLRKAIK